MLRLLSTLDFRRFSPRLYLVARTDDTSTKRVQHLEFNKHSSAENVSNPQAVFLSYSNCSFDSNLLVPNNSNIKK